MSQAQRGVDYGGSITGPNQVEPGAHVQYEHTFSGEKYFWRVKGATAANDQPINTWPDGWIPDTKGYIVIAWDSVDAGTVQLWQGNDQEAQLLTELEVAVRIGSCDGRIFYNGQNNQNLGWNITGDLYACPSTAQNTALYEFEFNRWCDGQPNNLGNRPNYLWTIKYTTASGRIYQEQWQNDHRLFSGTVRNPEIGLRLYSEIPSVPHQFPSGDYRPWGTAVVPTPGPLPDPIIMARIEVSGYSCGKFFSVCGLVEKSINVYYQPPTPGAVSVSGSGARCRTQTYSVSIPAAIPQATRYVWSATNGARITGTGTTATLDVSAVPPGTDQTVVRVVAWNDNAPCRKNSDPTPPVYVNLTPAPLAPQRLLLTGGLCPNSADAKILQIDPVGGATEYRWQISGPGARFAVTNGQTVSGSSLTQAIYLPQAGQATVTVRAYGSCSGLGAVTTQNFTVGDTPLSQMPTCPASLVHGFQCDGKYRVEVPAPAFGLDYVFQVNGVQPSGAQVVATNQNGPGFIVYDFPNGAPSSFQVELLITGCNRFRGCQVYTIVPDQFLCRRGEQKTAATSPPSAPTTLFPNPASDEVTIHPPNGQVYTEVQVLNSYGKLMLTQKTTRKDKTVNQVKISGLPAGIYVVRLYDGHTWTSQRLEKK